MGQKLAEMRGFDSDSVFYLLSARGAAYYDGRGGIISYRRKQDPLSNLHGDILVFFLEAKGASHSAASGI